MILTKKLTKRLFSAFVALMMMVALLPASAFAADPVAQIGDTTYGTLDAAVEAAADGDTITVLADCTTDAGLNLSKDLTIQGADNVQPTITFSTYGIALWAKALTFKDVNVSMTGIGSTPYTSEWNWMTISASKGASMTLDNVTMTMDGTDAGNVHAIYFCSNNVLNIKNGSTLTIKNYKQDALEWDGGDGGYNVNITDSTYISDSNRSGLTGTFYATIDNSTVEVINSTGNGSNGSNFVIKNNSKVNFSGNGSHGLSTALLDVDDSTITANDNGMTGIIFTGAATFNNSTVTITGIKGTSYWNAGMRAFNSNATCKIASDCKFVISDNYVTGIFLDASTSLTIEEGADVTVTRNYAEQQNCSTEKDLARSGGGIVVRSGATATLSNSTVIYNNHASVAGDDIYVEDTGTITFPATGSDWKLDGGTDCNGEIHAIDGWYEDGADGTRWLADTEDTTAQHIEKKDAGTLTGVIALKAAHGVLSSSEDEKTSYPGIQKYILKDGEEVRSDDIGANDTVEYELKSNVPQDLTNYLEPEDAKDPEIVDDTEDGEGTEDTETTSAGFNSAKNSGYYYLAFHDVLDENLTIDGDSITVTVGSGKLLAENGILYAYEKDEETGELETVEVGSYELKHTCETDGTDSLYVVMNLVAIYESVDADGNAYFTEEQFGEAEIIVTYKATANENLKAGMYKNSVWVEYEGGKTSEDIVPVYSYGINVFKYDQSTGVEGDDGDTTYTGLAGAEFELKDADGKVIATLTSGSDGFASVEGLDAGTYTLTETKAPSGYVKSDTPLTFKLPDNANASYFASTNFANSPVPHTGGSGTMMYTVGGIAILCLAGAAFVVSRRKESK